MLAKQLGYYDKAGVNVNLIDEPAGGDATQNMLAGQVQGVGGFYDHNIALQAQGKSSESVVSMLQIPGEVELCRSDLKGKITSPADFKGQSLGITDTGSSTDFLTQYLTKKAGVDPPTTTRRGVGAGQTFIAAMKQKAIACGMTTEPTVSQALSDGTSVHPARHAHRRGLEEGAGRHLPRDLALHDDRLRRQATRTPCRSWSTPTSRR